MARKKNKRGAINSKIRHLIAKTNPKSPIAEQFRTVRTNLQFSSVDKELNRVLITSSEPGDGKSFTVANLATVYAQQAKKVLLIDGDMRKPTVHYTFNTENLRGLSNLLVGETTLGEAVVESPVRNLDVLPSGPIPPNPSELLGTNRMKKLLEFADDLYDIILIDSPPVLAVADAKVLANIVDGAILVVRSRKTEYETAIRAKEALENTNAKLLGTILNDQEKAKGGYYYYYGS